MVLEIVALPLVHGAWLTAVVFSVANAVLLTVRIRAGERGAGEPRRLMGGDAMRRGRGAASPTC